MDRLVGLQEAADRTSTTVRFWRRVVAERRITVHKIGRHVRLAESDLEAFLEAGRRPAERAG
jgi:excisionase family DNA binding protein